METKRYVDRKLSFIMHYATRNIPFYKSLFRGRGRPVRLEDFPIIDKHLVRSRYNEFLLPGIKESKCWLNKTSGSTGEPMKILFDRRSASVYEKGCYYFPLFVSGYRPWHIMARQVGRPIRSWWRRLGFMRVLNLPITRDPLELIETMLKTRPDCLYVSPSFGVSLAVENIKTGRRLKIPRVFTTMETLFDEARRLISDAFEAEVVDRYGSAEFSGVAWTCPEGNYHIIPEQVVEVLDENGEQVSEGERGSLVITGLNNRVMPLIRYNTQDLAIMGGDEPCNCGCPWPYLARVEGRVNDFLTDHAGKPVSPMAFSALVDDYRLIRRFKVIQDKRGTAVLLVEPLRKDITRDGLEKSSRIAFLRSLLQGRIDLEVRIVERIQERGAKAEGRRVQTRTCHRRLACTRLRF